MTKLLLTLGTAAREALYEVFVMIPFQIFFGIWFFVVPFICGLLGLGLFVLVVVAMVKVCLWVL